MGNTYSIFFALSTVYNLNDSHVLYKNCSTFQKKHVGTYSEEIHVINFEKFHLLVTFFSFFLPFSPFTI